MNESLLENRPHSQTTKAVKEQVKWLAFGFIAVVFIAITYVARFSNTPTATQADNRDAANEIEFVPLQQQRELPEATPRIEAICISGNGQPSAYVGGKFVREGDIVNGFKILRIFPNKVEFERNGNTVVGVFPDKRRPARPKPDNFLQKQVSYKSSANYRVQHRQPSYSIPRVSENGSYYGQISENTGRPKTVYVRGYYRKDGTYVRSHYRSSPK